MAVCDDCFRRFVHPLVHESQEKNDRFREKYGEFARWDWHDERSTLTFSDPQKPKLEIDVSVVGTTQGDSWEWSWANANIPLHNKVDMEKVREFGEAQGYDKLTTAFLDADEYTGWEMTDIAVKVLDASGSYRFSTDHGFCYLVSRKIKQTRGRASRLVLTILGAIPDMCETACFPCRLFSAYGPFIMVHVGGDHAR